MSLVPIFTTRSGTALGEVVNPKERGVSLGVNRNPTARVTIRLDDPLADTILSGATLLKMYETGAPFGTPQLRCVAEVATVEEAGAGDGGPGSIVCTFAGPFTRFGERLLGKTATGFTAGTALAPRDKTLLVTDLLAAANAEGYTGVDVGTTSNTGATGYLAYAPYKDAASAIQEVVNNLDGPDFDFAFQEPQAVAGGTRIATMNVLASVGTSRPAAVFEYGTGRRNVVTYRRAVTYGIVNAGYGLPSSADPVGAVVSAVDATSIAAYGRREGLVNADLAVPALRQRLVDETVRVRKNPRQVITFQPAKDDASAPGRVPRFGVDYFLGDLVPFRAVANGKVRVNGTLRVYGVDLAADDQGNLQPTITLTAD